MKPSEFNEVLRIHGDTAYRMACHLTRGNETLARDLVQDAFVKIWKNWEWQRPESFKGWMYRILHNLYMDHLRKKTREASDSYDAPGLSEEQAFIDSLPALEPTTQERLEKKELHNALYQALDKLPEDFRVPILLCDMEGLSYEEIARVVSCPVGTVRSRIHRGRSELRRSLITWLPAVVGIATAIGALWLCKIQRNTKPSVTLPVAAAPRGIPKALHALLPKTESLESEKGESREN